MLDNKNTYNQCPSRSEKRVGHRRAILGSIAVGAGLLIGGTESGRDRIDDAFHPNKQPVRTQKFENVGPQGATVYEKIGDEEAPAEKDHSVVKD